jgi:hypothetical protein
MGFFAVADRYESHLRSAAWQVHARSCLALTGRRCVLFPFLWAQECHHLHYRNLGREVPVLDTVPLSWAAHQIIHFPLLWFPPVRAAINAWLRLMMVLLTITSPLRRWAPVAVVLLLGGTVLAAWHGAMQVMGVITSWF